MAGADPALTGQTINGYRILQKLGSGGMGVVFRAVDTRLNRQVALKFLPDEVGVNERGRSLLLMEAQAASALDHPNVGTIYGMEQTPEGRMFIVMAFYSGRTLSQVIAQDGPMPAPEVIRIATQIAEGLAEAHANHIIHRDVKPSNVILTPQGGVKILDFGLARVVSSASMTQSVGLTGTVAYMSPEQALGRGADHRSDLWALGVTMYEMLTGRLPFDGETSGATLMAIVHHAPKDMDGTVPPVLQRIVYRLLVKEATERYQDAASVAADLRSAAERKSSARSATQSELNRIRSLAAKPLRLSARSLSPVERWAIGGLCLLVVAVGGVVMGLLFRKPSAGADGAVEHIAVLPIETRSAAGPDAQISEGLRERITDRLSNDQAPGRSLWVVPASEVSAHKVQSASQAKEAYGANLVVVGRLERQGSSVRLRLELVDSAQMRELGAIEAESSGTNLADLEDTAVAELESRLGLSRKPADAQANASTSSTAYEDYLKALPLIDEWDKPHNIENASSLLTSAIQQDPNFTLAYVSLANADLIRFRATQDKSWLDKAAANCDKAQRLNAELPAVHVTLGRVQDASGHYSLALQEFKRALDLEPHSADATLGMALVYDHQGRVAEAEAAFRRALALRPDYWGVYNQLGDFYHRHGRMEDAIAQFRHAIELAPDSRMPYVNLGAVLVEAKRTDEATPVLEKAAALSPSYGVYANLAVLYLQEKRYADAERATEAALKLNDKDWRVWTNLATVRRWRKEEAEAREADLHALPLMKSAEKLDPQDADLEASLGLVTAHLGRNEEAESHINTALALGNGNGSIEGTAAEVEERLGNHKRAVSLLRKALHDGAPEDDFALDPEMQTLLADREVSRLIKRTK